MRPINILRRLVSKTFIEDCLIPFFCGFFGILFIFALRDKLSGDDPNLVASFQDKRGQLHLQRHGIQMKEEDLYKEKSDKLDLSLIAEAGSGFKKKYLATRTGKFKDHLYLPVDPPGSIWSWPRLEEYSDSRSLVWVVTPTYRNPYQYAELTRIAQALYPARLFVRWIVVDDTRRSLGHPQHLKRLENFLSGFNVTFKILKSKARKKGQKKLFKPKGVDARRTAIEHIRANKLKGVVYFADDDNTYDSDIFRQMQYTTTVSVWPTGAITQWTISSPVVDKKGHVVDFFDAWQANRKFPLDFASFAIHTDLLYKNPEANIPWIQGYEETILLKTLNVNKSQFMPLAANATEVLTWHTKTLKDYLLQDKPTMKKVLEKVETYPKSVQKLFEKYDFVFESPPEIPPDDASPDKDLKEVPVTAKAVSKQMKTKKISEMATKFYK